MYKKMELFHVIIITATLLIIPAESTPFKKCKVGISPLKLDVVGCSETPCKVHRGKNVTASVDFRSSRDTVVLLPKVKAYVNLYVSTYTRNIQFSQQDGCSTLTRGQCPLKKNEFATYFFTIPIKPSEMKVKADIEVSLSDHGGNVIVCTLLPISIY